MPKANEGLNAGEKSAFGAGQDESSRKELKGGRNSGDFSFQEFHQRCEAFSLLEVNRRDA